MKVIYYNNHQDVKILVADGLAYGRSLVADGSSINTPMSVVKVMSDFEAPLWWAVRSVFGSNVTHKGHLSLDAGSLASHAATRPGRCILGKRYSSSVLSSSTKSSVSSRKRIPEAFQDIKDRAEMLQFKSLIGYVESTWIDSTLWPPAAWSVYRSSVRTNNDCESESWHARLNRKASTDNLPLYN